ncbi:MULTISPECIES: SDR family oxidoreductase [Rhizobium]|uniref:SDR family oxidoreductase n=1 Tax=Rhizobium TaxID=379 RepID=UPI0007EBABBA|nr:MULTISPECIES: SDR family oxidoreductase [Rhizobium]ANK94781.1 short-chain dehydrogenase/reductase SDR family protein [Rhizobium sp. N6212]ANL00831.1 short-chain dehydrogenase/reductase SDR family protein [Rhizobium sp. N621]ANL06952.1 short-chain dehydrogenase/reductase SDR family protein [Rhizobium esperanzae]ANL13122.1 short-chain dehydrogenase/reductase SDR family protein [Rhizobium sp. N1341]ANL25106.1 short-chain dehydrogenase/reductase SDR family protein [Rhizobium sp. N113]
MTIENKVVVITGAGSGMGRATALHLAERGARVVLGGRREDRIASVAADIKAIGGDSAYRSTDVTKREDLTALVDLACSEFGRLDVIVNNAGIGPLSRFDALQVNEWEETIDINVKGVLYGIAAALPVFGKQQSGHVITVVSTAGLRVLPKMGVYAASKNAVRTIMEALRQESGPNIRVTEISPGAIQTEFLKTVGDEAEQARLRAWSDRIAIPADSIARAIAFAIDQPDDVEIGSIVVRPTAQD